MTGFPRAGGLRLIRLVLVAIAIGTAMNSAATVLLFRASQESGEALCALRLDLERRSVASREYLREHPNGAPGIPAKAIRDGLRNQDRTISALSGINC